MESNPAVSVIIPLYNSEKFIGKCIESILMQTFPNFELIVVDDCSTDNSLAIAESYLEKFNGRMTLLHFEKNSGGAATPRNKGLILSRGEYIYYVDADDMIIETALEEMYELAQNYNADVVYYSRFYELSENGLIKEVKSLPIYKPGDKIVLDNNLLNRINDMMNSKYLYAPWRIFCQRKFLIENEIFFPNTKPYEDIIRGYAVLIYAKNFLRVPNPIYLYRNNESSMTRSQKTAVQNATFYLNPMIFGLKSLDDLISRHEFFKANPRYRYEFLQHFVFKRFNQLYNYSFKLSPVTIYEAIKSEFGERFGEYDVLIPMLCSYANILQRYYVSKSQELIKFESQNKARIAELEKSDRVNKLYISELENCILDLQQRIAELENELKSRT